jgi:hypothetical protein
MPVPLKQALRKKPLPNGVDCGRQVKKTAKTIKMESQPM